MAYLKIKTAQCNMFPFVIADHIFKSHKLFLEIKPIDHGSNYGNVPHTLKLLY